MSSNDERKALFANYHEEFVTHQAIRSVDYLFDSEACSPLSLPDNPFHFESLFDDDPEALPSPGGRSGTPVAVIGAGAAGMAAANLLMRAGLKPVVYELSDRIGGRAYTRPFDEDPAALGEMGSMRIPRIQELIFFLCRRWGIDWHDFPNPLVVDTVVDVYDQQVLYHQDSGEFTGDPALIARIQQVQTLYSALIDPLKATWDSTAGDLEARARLWQNFVQLYNNKSFYQMLVESGWTEDQIQLFGFIGIGSGGFDSFFGASFLEILRVEIQDLETNQQLIVGGTEQIPRRLWDERVSTRHWGTTSVEELNGGKTRPGVKKIRSDPEGKKVTIEDLKGEVAEYKAVILTPTPRAIEMTLDIDQGAFSQEVWNSLRDLEIVASEKVFILTKTAFWNGPDPETKFFTTLSDRAPRQMYLFDSKDFTHPTDAGVMCVSYAWAASSIKFDSLTNEQRVEVCLDAIEKMNIYGPQMRQKIEQEMIGTYSLTWEDQYGYNGGWRMASPGQADSVHTLHQQGLGLPAENDNGLYLAGEALSWYGLSGWIDGAIKTGLQAAVTAIRRVANSG